jgi:hypothetical protein
MVLSESPVIFRSMRLYVGVPRLIVLVTAIAAAGSGVAGAQTATIAPPSGVELRAGYEARREHLRYTFDNPSNIDTDFPVPHSFTQRYVASNHWLTASARYQFRHDVMQTEFAVTPERQTAGSDLDTFHDPNNDVVISGTNGEVLMRSLRLAHWSEGRLFGWPWRVGYSFRRDRAQFLPADRIVTHTNPPSELRSPTLGHETTISQVHEIAIDASRPASLSAAWRFIATAEVSPLIFARLVTRLPDKYPGQDIIFDAKSFGVGAGLQLVHEQRFPLTISLQYRQAWGYRAARQYRRDSVLASVGLGF